MNTNGLQHRHRQTQGPAILRFLMHACRRWAARKAFALMLRKVGSEAYEDKTFVITKKELRGSYKGNTDRKFNRMRPSMARVLGLETRSAKEG